MRQTNKIRKGIAWLLCTVLVLGILPMLPQMSMQISAAENAASVFVDGVELHAGGKKYFKNGDTADSGATGTDEDHSAYYDTAGELWLNNLEAHTIKANGNLTIYVCNNQETNTNIVTATQNETAIEVTGYLTIQYGGYGETGSLTVESDGKEAIQAGSGMTVSDGVEVKVRAKSGATAISSGGVLKIDGIRTKLEAASDGSTGKGIFAQQSIYVKNSAVLTAFGGAAAYESPSGIDKSGYGYEDYNVFTGDAAPGTQAAKDTALDGYKYIRIEPTGVANVKTLTELQAAAQNQYISLINVMNDITITDTVYVRRAVTIQSPDVSNVSKLIRGKSHTDVILDFDGANGHKSDVVTLKNIIVDGNKDGNTQTASPALKSKSILVDLESGTVIENNHAKEGAAIYVNHYSTVTMKEGSEIRNNLSESDGTVYVIGNGGYFEMAGGTISGNTVAGNGGGIYEFGGGSARMTGGTISGNTAKGNGGGVYNVERLYGGTITGNSTSGNGGGVFVPVSGACLLNSDINISGNYKDGIWSTTEQRYTTGTANNLYLSDFGSNVYVEGSLAGNAKIGITSALETYPVSIGGGDARYIYGKGYVLKESDVSKFVSDKNGFVIKEDNNELFLKKEAATLKASDFQFKAPQSLIYNGEAKAAEISKKNGTSCGDITVEYYRNGKKVTPVNAGTYIAKINVAENDNYLAASGLTDSSWTFTIEPRKLLVSVADVVIDRGDAMPELTVRVDGFADGEDENSIAGFQKPTAKVKGTVNTNDTNVKNFEVTYSGGKATANYQFVENTIAKITINSTDTTAPEITGVTNGKTYCSKVTVTVTDKDLDTVKLDGKKVTLKDDKFTVSPKSGKQKIEAVDKAGNRTTVSITVNNGHTKSDWIIDELPTSTKEGSRHKECTVCGALVDSVSIPKLTPSNPENPTKPDPENPTKPDPEKPTKPDPENPTKPDPEKPTNPEKPTQKKYKVIEGADATYTINKDGNLTMRADGKYKNFKGIEIDGKTVDSKNYTAWSGSTYVKFKKDFVNTLSGGKHTVKFTFTDGYATTSLTIAKKDNSDTKNPSDNKKPDTNTNTSGNGTNNTTTTANTQVKAPKTGDTFQPILWAGILCASVAGMAGVVAADKKRKKCQ